MQEIKQHSIPWFFEVLIVLYVFHTTLPIFGYYTPAIVHASTMFILFILLAVYDQSFWRNLVLVLPIFSVHILHLLYFGLSRFAIEVYSELQLYVYPLLALYLMRYANYRSLKRILLLIGISYLITAVTTYIGNQVFPLASRHLAAVFQSDEEYMYDIYMKMNIGGFNIIYTYVLLVPIIIYMYRYKIIPRIFTIAILVLFSSVILISEYTTALFTLILTIAGLLLMKKSFGSKQVITLVSLAVFAIFVLDSFIFPYLSNFTGLFGSEIVDGRLMELSEFSTGSSSYSGDLGSRYDFYMMSVDSFFNSPIWGGRNAALGGHSFMFDTLGGYGLLGVLAMVLMYRQLFKVFYKPFEKSDFYGYAIFIYAWTILLAILNPKDNLSLLTFIVPVTASFFFKIKQTI